MSRLSFCGACGIPLAEGATRSSQQTPERAEWVVSTLRRRCWLLRVVVVVFLGILGLVAWRLGPIGPTDMRLLASVSILLGVAGTAALVARIWRCPECQASLGDNYEPRHFCTRCGVPHDRKGLERARTRA